MLCFNNVKIDSVKENIYRIQWWYISKDEAINIIKLAQGPENTRQVYFRTGLRYIFFYISMFVVSIIIDMSELNIDIGQRPYWISLFFFTLN